MHRVLTIVRCQQMLHSRRLRMPSAPCVHLQLHWVGMAPMTAARVATCTSTEDHSTANRASKVNPEPTEDQQHHWYSVSEEAVLTNVVLCASGMIPSTVGLCAF